MSDHASVSSTITKDSRFFLVGSARSGTTLLQAMLAAHSAVHSFPETHFFCELPLMGRRFRWAKMLHRERAESTFRHFLSVIGRDDLSGEIPTRSPFYRSYVNAYVRVLDRETLQQGKRAWVEKTPHHIDFIRQISAGIPGVRFIHIVRDGRDVIASQVDAASKSPEHWGHRSMDEVIALWNSDIAISAACVNLPHHLVVSYEDLITEPARELQRACRFIGISFEESMLSFHRDVAQVLGWRDSHEYMSNVHKPVNDTRLVKFRALFTPEQQRYISERLTFEGNARKATGLA